MNQIRIDINPIAAPRQSRSDAWNRRKCVMKYRAFCDILRLECKQKGFVISDCEIQFFCEVPKYLKNKILPGELKRTRPDIDNLIKSVFDALLDEDGCIARVTASKRYTTGAGYIIIKNITGDL